MSTMPPAFPSPRPPQVTGMDEFLWRALAAGIGVALVTGPLGCFVVWRRMAYFGDTLAHSALLGVALGYLLNFSLHLGVTAVSLAVALLLVLGLRRQSLGSDTLLGILSHAALASGLVLTAFMEELRVDLMTYLFGDVLAVTVADLLWIWGGGLLVLGLLLLLWRHLLAMTVHEELAVVEGVPVQTARLGFMLLMALTVSVALKVVGIILVTSLLIMPAAAARRFAATPEQMAALAAVLGCVAVVGGLAASATLDTPSGPSIVVAGAVLFLISALLPGERLRTQP